MQYRDAAGEVRGILTYTLAPHERDIVKGTAKVTILIVETDDAYAALWRFLLELDLVAHVRAELCSVDEPVLWMIGDRRAASVSVFDHQYLRIVDVPAALRARTYGAAGRLLLRVSDPLGIATGEYLLTIDDGGAGTVSTAADADTTGADVLDLSVVELAAVYLGGVSPETLGRAGRLTGTDLAASTRMFASTTVPRVGLWY
ncbi:putative acetyltransferase [Microbacterium sp. TS-1]|nr:putative acetyltransferase [Microbacterium sp. TS-1]